MLKRTTPLKRGKRLRPMSARRQAEAKIYSEKRKAFLAAHPWCQWFLEKHGWTEGDMRLNGGTAHWLVSRAGFAIRGCDVPLSTEVHHKAKRGKNYLNEATWMAVSRMGHDFIHQNPKLARKLGWLL